VIDTFSRPRYSRRATFSAPPRPILVAAPHRTAPRVLYGVAARCAPGDNGDSRSDTGAPRGPKGKHPSISFNNDSFY
jgi:hypothetical protein